MTTPDRHFWSATALKGLATSLVGQEHVGALAGVLLRLARFLGGDPAQWLTVTSAAAGTVAQLPDNVVAQSAVFTVTGNPIVYRIDGSAPIAATDPQAPVGTVLTLTGRPTFIAFRFASTVAAPASIVGAYYD